MTLDFIEKCNLVRNTLIFRTRFFLKHLLNLEVWKDAKNKTKMAYKTTGK